MLLERLAREYLSEQVRGVSLAGDMAYDHTTRAAELPHLEELSIDVSGVLSGRVPVSQVERRLAIGMDVHSL